ncbi:unnamed protein product [Linum tenue]|uniref:Homeobox domain-containing protein n=1 Tax=Linum tenue TaxID=586396 RepID=A0AAV0NTI5_9ROSI|nr:unnamed protein product [Linum tenue]
MEQEMMNGGNNVDSNNNNNSSNGVKGSFLCRQSSSRWTPTTEQIRILKELYYNDGVRSPSAEQIQRISADLRRYGKIEGKNVFYWFQNHKARERQKKRFTNQPASASAVATHHPNTRAAAVQPSSTGALGHGGGYGGYASLTMEKSLGDCSISSAGGNSNKVGGGQYSYGYGYGYGYGWGGFDHHPYSTSSTNNSSFFIHNHGAGALEEDHQDHQQQEIEIETLPLFPTHREDLINGFSAPPPCPYATWYAASDHCHDAAAATNSFASLELTLNSFTSHSSSSNMF